MHEVSERSVSALERTALKEWAVLCNAMARGELIALVRKGGIREQRAGFSVRHSRFLLYPTYFHEKADELQPRFRSLLARSAMHRPEGGTVALSLVAQVAGVWAVSELERLRLIEGEHGLVWGAVESRFRYRNRPGVQVIAARIRRLAQIVTMPGLRRYQGCVSWVALDEGVDVSAAEPVLSDELFASRLAAIGAALGEPRAGG